MAFVGQEKLIKALEERIKQDSLNTHAYVVDNHTASALQSLYPTATNITTNNTLLSTSWNTSTTNSSSITITGNWDELRANVVEQNTRAERHKLMGVEYVLMNYIGVLRRVHTRLLELLVGEPTQDIFQNAALREHLTQLVFTIQDYGEQMVVPFICSITKLPSDYNDIVEKINVFRKEAERGDV